MCPVSRKHTISDTFSRNPQNGPPGARVNLTKQFRLPVKISTAFKEGYSLFLYKYVLNLKIIVFR